MTLQGISSKNLKDTSLARNLVPSGIFVTNVDSYSRGGCVQTMVG